MKIHKVEKILKGSLNSIPSPSPSVKIQIMGGKVCLRRKGKTLLHSKLSDIKPTLLTPLNKDHLISDKLLYTVSRFDFLII